MPTTFNSQKARENHYGHQNINNKRDAINDIRIKRFHLQNDVT